MAEKVFFFYGESKVEVDQPVISGAALKAAILAANVGYTDGHDLLLEGHGHAEDQVITNDMQVDLSHGHGVGPKHFLSRPPTNFG